MWGITRVHSGIFTFSHIRELRCVKLSNQICFYMLVTLAFFSGKGFYRNWKTNRDISNICEWFVDNILSIYFGENKIKSILFASTHKKKKVLKLNVTYTNIQIKHHSKATYLGCTLDETISGESMVLKVMNKINSRIKISTCEKLILTPALCRLLSTLLFNLT